VHLPPEGLSPWRRRLYPRPVRVLLLAVAAAATACAPADDDLRAPALTLPDGDRVVRTLPGDCQELEGCIVSEPRYESVTEVAGEERSAEELGRLLADSLAESGWVEVPADGFGYGAGEVAYPYRFQRGDADELSYLVLYPVLPGSYGLAYDEDGDTLSDP